MIQVTITFLDRGSERCSVEYRVKNEDGTELENTSALISLGLLNVFFENSGENEFLTTEQGARVRKKVDQIVTYVNSIHN